MNRLEQLIEETDFTSEEWNIFRKVEKNNYLHDLKNTLDCMLENDEITEEQYNEACENADFIIERYEDNLVVDWETTLVNVIKFVIGD